MNIEEVSEAIRLLFACGVDYCEGVSVEKITDKKHAIPLKTTDGSLFGIIVEVIDKK